MEAPFTLDRRQLVAGLTCALASALVAVPAEAASLVGAIERRHRVRIGAVIRAADGRQILAHRAHERFLMCSTFKVFLVGAVLGRACSDPGLLQRRVVIPAEGRVANSPVTGRVPGGGSMSVEDLCAAAIEASDNTAANCLLDILGGPAGMTRAFREMGDKVSRLDRREPELNLAAPGDPRDTSTPSALAGSLRRLLLGPGSLSDSQRARILGWMERERNGTRRIRAGLPSGWTTANKPGTSNAGAVNDIALVRSPSGRAFVVAICIDSPGGELAANEALIARIVRTAGLPS